jgi:hypothetical protein
MTVALRWAGIFVQFLCVKLIAASSLIAASWLASTYSSRRDARYAIPALVSVGLNPICLMEGPGNGHSDAFMIALCLASLCLYDAHRHYKAAFTAGLSIAAKFVPLAVFPWILLDGFQTMIKTKPRALAALCLLVVGPAALLMLPFWDHGAALQGLLIRVQTGDAGIRHQLVTQSATARPDVASQIISVATGKGGTILLYAAITALLLFRSRLLGNARIRAVIETWATPGSYPAWLVCWALFASLAVFSQMKSIGFWVSWYCLWSIPVAASIWTKRGSPLYILATTTALAAALRYTEIPS